MTQQSDAVGTDARWRARPVLAALVRAALVLIPLGASGLAVLAVDRAAPAGERPWLWLGLALLAAVAVGMLVERSLRRFLPLAVLLDLDLLFPTEAPSRYRIAREAVSRAQTDLARTPAGTAEHVLRLIGALGLHDRRTRGHCERVRVLTDLLASELKLGAADRDRLRWAALLHDLGKLEVPVDVLNKPTRLSPRELATMRTHPEAGAELAAPLLDWLGEWGRGIVEHHERYDGSGYPAGLAGTGISRAGRMVGLVDAFETMTAARSYKKAMATAAAREELARCSGTHFDPVCVRAFLAVPLPRLLWAMGPVSFVLQVPFLRMLAEAGRLSTQAGAAAGPAAAVVGAAVLAVTGVGDGAPDLPERGGSAQSAPQTLNGLPAVLAGASTGAPPGAVPVVGPPTGLQPEPPPDVAPDSGVDPVRLPAPIDDPAPAPTLGPPTGLEPARPVTEPVLEAIGPLVEPVVELVPDPALGPVVEPAVEIVTDPVPVPVVEPLLEPVLEPVIELVTDPVLEPVIELVTDPLLEPITELVTGPALEPVVGPVLETVTPVLEPVLGPVLDPVLEPVVDAVVETVQPVLDPVVGTLEPVLDTTAPVVDAVVETVQPVLDTVDPVVETVVPVLDPVVEAVEPVTEVTEPLLTTIEPVVETTDPVVGALDPVVDTVNSSLPLNGLLGG